MKSNLDKFFKEHEQSAKEGVDFVIQEASEENKEISFRVRYFSDTNPRTKAAFATHYKPYARQVQMDTLDEKKDREIQVKIFIDISLVSWTGVEIDGKEAECNKENAFKLFMARPELFKALMGYAQDFKNYREDLGNS